ncbi:MAG: hypothetical protein ACU84J_07245 [Gammaproteobacteria bacterium]
MNFSTDRQCANRADRLNSECRCVSLNKFAMRAELSRQQNDDALYRMIVEERPHLFAESAVFVAESCLLKQRDIIDAVERTVALPAYRERVLAYGPKSAHYVPKAHGVFLGYDFHLSPDGPKLIEINTNAGGALLNTILARAQTACCDLVDGRCPGDLSELLRGYAASKKTERAFIDMFLEEWRAERGERPLQTVAIVDDDPESQYMWPEFLLFKKLFERAGMTAVICDPSALAFEGGELRYGGAVVDLVYNRLTDFALEEAKQRAILAAYLTGAVVVTPHPRAHALYADKRNLTLLSDAEALEHLGIDAETRAVLLNGIAHTVSVRPENRESLWAERKHLFFKPAKGYGSKAAYRGDKLTRRVFEEIFRHEYVAQTLVQPSERQLEVDNAVVGLKLDLRNYVYNGRIQLLSARLYRGQTTNFRTPGGGFAQVVAVPCGDVATPGAAEHAG